MKAEYSLRTDSQKIVRYARFLDYVIQEVQKGQRRHMI